jgi:O-acetyl-ADP-ribose deacetylase (regulator of RNase III)
MVTHPLMDNLKLILVDPDLKLCAAFKSAFRDVPNVEVVPGRFEDLPRFDCFITAGNSFGMMDAGVDAAVVRFFGFALMARVQQRILDDFLGEQPVGSSFIVETDHPDHPFLAHTPTMRVPMAIDRTDYVYKAMRASLLAIRAHNQHAERRIEIAAVPGLGTGYGQVPPLEAARQMSLAYKTILNPPRHLDWTVAALRHKDVKYGGNSPPNPL